MAIYCPILNRKVIYLTCQECEDKLCKKEKTKETIKQEEVKTISKNNYVRKQF